MHLLQYFLNVCVEPDSILGGQNALISKMKCLIVLSYKLTMCGTGSMKMDFVSMMEFQVRVEGTCIRVCVYACKANQETEAGELL